MRERPHIAVLFAAGLAVLVLETYTAAAGAAAKGNAGDRLFVESVKPLLSSRCWSCHGAEKIDGGLRLDSRAAAIKGGDTGPALVPGKPDESLLLLAVKRTHKVLEMPPKDKLSSRDIATLERWIREGASWPADEAKVERPGGKAGDPIGDAWRDRRNPIVQLFGGQRLDLWSLQPVKRPALPVVKNGSWVKRDFDSFVLARLDADRISPPAMADARTVARRLYFDLTGLPPTAEQVRTLEKSAKDKGADAAVGALVDKTVASPRFGEHFAQLWLDVVRYSDSNGFDWDEFRPQAWRYRDYVVRSFNADKPFDQFTREQLAGDELVDGEPKTDAERDCLIATGYLRLGPHDNAAGLFNEQDRSRAELMADVTETTAGAFLGMTMTCCRCHDHKYDPLSQADHYRFRAFFAAMRFADDVPLELANEQAAIKGENQKIEEQAKGLRAKLASLPQTDKSGREALEKQAAAVEKKRRAFTHGLLMTDNAANVAATQVLFQGDHKAPRAVVEAGVPTMFDPQPAKLVKPASKKTTGRRLTLANWIASPQNPLTARVFVNRVWDSFMGRPIVSTPNDFGLAGARPEDQKLLDWLASDFVENGWSVKKLVREIVTSAAYRQVPAFDRGDFGLRSPRRLRAEELRDSMLYVSGLLTAKSDGPPVWPDLPKEVLDSNPSFFDDNPEKTKGWYPSPKADQFCRSLFLIQKRNTRTPLLESFDLPENSISCPRRQVSTIAPQALMLLNDPLTAETARAFAARVEKEVGKERGQQVRRAFELGLQRVPDEVERKACERLLAARGLAELCRALVNLNEFVYLD